MNKFRKALVFYLFLFSYFLFVYYFFVADMWWAGLTNLLLLYIVAHYFLIDIKFVWIRYIVWILIVMNILEMFVIWVDNTAKLISLYVFHLWFIVLLVWISEEVNNRREISPFNIFSIWYWSFVVFLSMFFSIAFVGRYHTFTLNCDQIYTYLEDSIKIVSKPLYLPRDILNKIKWIKEATPKKYWEETVDISLIKKYSDFEFSFLVKPEYWQVMVVKQILKDKRLVDKWFCEIVVENIKEKYQSPWFKASVVILMFLLFFPFLKILFILFSFINMMIYWLLRMLKVYRCKKFVENVEEIF